MSSALPGPPAILPDIAVAIVTYNSAHVTGDLLNSLPRALDGLTDYGVPLATRTAVSTVAADAHRTFAVAARVLGLLLAARQEQAGVPPRDRVLAQIVGDSGPIIQTGSRPRVFGGLALLAAIAVGLAWNGAGRRGAGTRSEPAARDYDR